MVAFGAYRLHTGEGLSGMVMRALVAIFLLGTLVFTVLFVPLPALYSSRGILAITAISRRS